MSRYTIFTLIRDSLINPLISSDVVKRQETTLHPIANSSPNSVWTFLNIGYFIEKANEEYQRHITGITEYPYPSSDLE